MIGDKIHSAIHFFKHLFSAKTAHGVHSPFIFGLINEVIRSKDAFYAFDEIEEQRAWLFSDQTLFTRVDFGAGAGRAKQTRISDFARRSLCRPKDSQLLFRLSRYVGCHRVLELGTALGVTSAYLAKSKLDIEVDTLEGDPSLANKSKELWSRLNITKINSFCGEFSELLPQLVRQNGQYDLVFLDGNHRKKPTLEYVELLKSKLSEEAVVVVDDIYWSKEMTEAWKLLKSDPEFSLSVDLYRMGLLFKRKGVVKQDFVLYF